MFRNLIPCLPPTLCLHAGNLFWISECWETVRRKMKAENAEGYIRVIDEVQKIDSWSEAVKKE